MHEWAIEAREYARHEARRGRRHAYEQIDPMHTALVVIDMVPFFLDENPYALGIVGNIARLADELRSVGGTVAWVVPRPRSPTPTAVEFFGHEVADRYARSGGDGPPRDRVAAEFELNAVFIYCIREILKEERNRRRLLQQEMEDLKVGPDSLPWMRTGQRLVIEARDNIV